MCQICSKLTIKTTECRRFGVFIANFERISHLFLVFSIIDIEQVNVCWVVYYLHSSFLDPCFWYFAVIFKTINSYGYYRLFYSLFQYFNPFQLKFSDQFSTVTHFAFVVKVMFGNCHFPPVSSSSQLFASLEFWFKVGPRFIQKQLSCQGLRCRFIQKSYGVLKILLNI